MVRASEEDLEGEGVRKRYSSLRPCSMMFHVAMTKQFCNVNTKNITMQCSSNSWLHTQELVLGLGLIHRAYFAINSFTGTVSAGHWMLDVFIHIIYIFLVQIIP